MPEMRWSKLFAAVFLGVLAGLLGWQLLARLYPVLIIVGAGFAIAYLLDPLLTHLEKRGWTRGQGIGLLVGVLLVALALAGLVLVPAAVSQTAAVVSNWQSYSAQIEDWVQTQTASLQGWLTERYPDTQIESTMSRVQMETRSLLDRLPRVLTWMYGALTRSAALLGVVVLTLLIALYFMAVIKRFRQGLAAMFPPEEQADIREIDREVSLMLGQYLRGMALTCLGVGISNTLLLLIVNVFFGTQYWLLVGMISGIAYLVPWLGMAVTVLSAGLLGYLTAGHDPWVAATCSVGAVVLTNQVFDNLVMPRIVGRRVGLHPLVIIIALLAGGALMGLWGMVLATPLAAIIKIVLARWLPVVPPEPERPLTRQPLLLDMETALGKAWQSLRKAGDRIEDAILPGHEEPKACPPQTPTKDANDDDTGTAT